MSATANETQNSDAFSVLGEALESAAENFNDATANARDSARAAAHSVQRTVGTGVYKGAYGLSYGVVFGAVFLTELLPETSSLRRGFEDGAGAALDDLASRRALALAHEPVDDDFIPTEDELPLAEPVTRKKRTAAARKATDIDEG